MRTRTLWPVSVRVTFTTVPKGRLGWAAVRLPGLKRSPEAVGLPLKPGPYQEAMPTSSGGRWAQARRRRSSHMGGA